MPQPAADDPVQQIKARLNLVDVIQEHVRLRKQGHELVGLCPFHQEKTGSFYVNEPKQAWICRGCGRGGDVFRFVELIEKTDFKGALEILAERTDIELTQESGAARERSQKRRRVLELYALAVQYYAYILTEHRAGEPGRRLLAERGVSDEVAERFALGYAPGGDSFAAFLRKKGRPLRDAIDAGLVRRSGRDFFEDRLLIPIRDESARPLAFTGRTVLKDEMRKYVNSPENPAYVKGRVLFGLDLARDEIGRQGYAVLMEGQFDVIAAHQRGVQNAIAVSGTALTEQQVRLLRRFTEEVVLVFDTDSAGRTAVRRAIELAAAQELRTRVASLPAGKDPDEFLRGAGSEASQRWAQVIESAPQAWEHWIREEIAGLNPTRPRDFEIGLGRVNAVLERIPNPALRASYRERAANWFGVQPHLMEVKPSARRPERRDETRTTSNGLPPEQRGKELSVELRYLIKVLVARPEAAATVAAQLAPEHVEGDDRDAYSRMLQTLQRGGTDALQEELDAFPSEWQVAVREALVLSPPRSDDAVINDVIGKIEQRSMRRRLHSIQQQIEAAETRRDHELVAKLEAQHRDLGRNVLKGESR